MKDSYFYLIAAVGVMLAVALVILLPIPVYDTTTIVPSKPYMVGTDIFVPVELKENTIQDISEAPSCVTNIKNQTIDAGYGSHSCNIPDFYTPTKILKISGFYGVYHNSTNDRIDTYILEPGHSGAIEYSITGKALRYEGSKPPGTVIKNQTEISNYTAFIHHQLVTVPQTVRMSYHTEPNGTKIPYYTVCHQSSPYPNGGMECSSGPLPSKPSDQITMDAMMYSHPGVDISYQFPSRIINDNQTITVVANVSVASDASTGTYWVILSPGMCVGGQELLLEITKCGDEK